MQLLQQLLNIKSMLWTHKSSNANKMGEMISFAKTHCELIVFGHTSLILLYRVYRAVQEKSMNVWYYTYFLALSMVHLFSFANYADLRNVLIILDGLHAFVMLRKSLVFHKSLIRPFSRVLLSMSCIISCCVFITFQLWTGAFTSYEAMMPNGYTMMLFAYIIPLLIDWKDALGTFCMGPIMNCAWNKNNNIFQIIYVSLE